MITNHTPGPWVVDDDGDVCTDDLERLVAAVDWRHVSLRNGEALANAHLIAAAPDLLHACEALLAGSSKAVLFARIAIARAKNEP